MCTKPGCSRPLLLFSVQYKGYKRAGLFNIETEKHRDKAQFYMQIRLSLVWSIVTGASPLLFSKIETLYKDIENKSTDGMKM